MWTYFLLCVHEKIYLETQEDFEWHCELGTIIKGFLEEMECHPVYKGYAQERKGKDHSKTQQVFNRYLLNEGNVCTILLFLAIFKHLL